MKLAKFALTSPLVAIGIALCAALSSFGAFRYETTLTVDGYKEAATLENFPLLVRISSARISGFSYSLCQADGKDIQFTSEDGKTVYPHEIDEWNTGDGEESLVWVRVPLSAGLKLKMKFGDTSMEEPPAYSVNGSTWTGADYFSVYHFGETANIGTKDFRAADSTANGYEMKPGLKGNNTTCATMTSQSGIVGRAVQTFDPDSAEASYLQGVNYNEQGVSDVFTLSGWINIVRYMTNAGGLYNRKNRDNDANGWDINTISATQFSFYGSGDWQARQNITVGTVVGTMIYVTVVVNGTTEALYVNGELKGSVTVPAPTNNTQPFRIGGDGYVWDQATPVVADETRLRKGNSSAEWIAADYASQIDAAYVSATAVEEVVVEGNTITITATPEELPVEGITYGPDQKIVPGDVEFTASAEMQAQGEHHYRVLGWNLTVYGSDGSTTKSSDEGCTCAFTHKNGDTEKLEWVLGDMYGVTATSADETRGTVTGTGYYDAGAEATFTATPLAGFEFVKWVSADVPPEQVYSPEVTLTVTKPMSLQATFAGKRYQWKDPAAGNWTDSTKWKNGEIPPNDGTADVVFPGGTADYIVTMQPTGSLAVRSLSVTSPTGEAGNKHVILSGGTIEVGEGGLSYDDSAYSCGIEFRNAAVKVVASQTWLITSAKNQTSLYFNGGSVYCAEGIVWTIAGKSTVYFNGTSCANMKGKLRSNAKFSFYGTTVPILQDVTAPGVVEFFDAADPIAGNSSGLTYPEVVTSNENYIVSKAPVNLALATKYEFGYSRGTYIKDNAWRYLVTSPFTGSVIDKGLVLSCGTATLSTHFPFKQHVTLAGDMTGLAVAGDDWISLSQGVFILDNDKAIGDHNVYFGNAAAGGYMTGLLTKDGIDVSGDLELTPQNAHIVLGTLDEAGETTYSGAITASGLASNKKTQLHLFAAKDATVNVTGSLDLSDANNLPVVAEGGGTVALTGDNAAMNQKGVIVRSASLVLGSNTAAGTQAISLGDTVPGETTVRALLDTSLDYVGGGWQYYGIKQVEGVWTISKNLPFRFDGLTLAAGDRFFHSPNDSAAGCIYVMTSDSTFVKATDVTYAEGLRIHVTEGNNFGGKTVYLARGTTATGGTVLEDVANPDVKVLAKNGVTIANAIDVTDNKSTGVSAIGAADASAVTFSGDITLAKDVYFEAAKGGVVNVTGTVSGSGNVGFSGLGTVRFTKGLDVAGRVITVRLPVGEVPTEGLLKCDLAQGLAGKAAGVTVTTADGSAVPAEWVVRQSGSRIVFRNKTVGLQVIVR